MKSLFALIRLGRLHFLVGGLIFYGLGAAMALAAGSPLNLAALLWGQIAVTATQLMTHYANDYFDLAADRLNPSPTPWSGGSRVLVDQDLPPRAALVAALVLAGIAFAANLLLSTRVRPGLATFALLFIAQALAWGYSAPPLRLHSRGIGELTASLTVALLTPLTGYYLQTGTLTRTSILALIPLWAIQFDMLLAVEFPDVAGDRLAVKRTLVVRLGPSGAARLYAVLLLLAYLILPLLGLPLNVTLGIAAGSPLALWLLWRISRGDGHNPARWAGLAFFTITLLLATALIEGLLWLARAGR